MNITTFIIKPVKTSEFSRFNEGFPDHVTDHCEKNARVNREQQRVDTRSFVTLTLTLRIPPARMESAANKAAQDAKRQDEIKQQIALLQSQLEEFPDHSLTPPRKKQKTGEPSLIAPATPSPRTSPR